MTYCESARDSRFGYRLWSVHADHWREKTRRLQLLDSVCLICGFGTSD